MQYATLQDLIERYGEQELLQVADRETPPAGEPDADIVARALTDASAEIDSYLAVKYAVPLTLVPDAIRSTACVIARYRLHDDHATDRIRDDYEDAVRWLKDVAAGRAIITELVPPDRTIGVAVRAPAPIFTEALMETMP